MRSSKNLELKPLFLERIKKLLTDEKDLKNYLDILKQKPLNSIRCNTLKISPEKLKQRLEKSGWKISQPWNSNPEVMIVQNNLMPGELGRSFEHLLGYYYIQELASMLPIIALTPKKDEIFLDLCASPGSKTTQAAAKMQNTGTIIANDVSLGRIMILASNLEKCGVVNSIITHEEGKRFCEKIAEKDFKFDKILVDAPCSGEGTLRSTPATYLMWNINTIKQLSGLQKRLFLKSFELLKPKGEIIYSTCTHAPEENEEIIDYALKALKDRIEILDFELPIKTRKGIIKWQDKIYDKRVEKAKRVYPHDNNTEGFFIAKFRRIK